MPRTRVNKQARHSATGASAPGRCVNLAVALTQFSDVALQTTLGQALGYLDEHWDGLIRYCDDGRLEIDNNLCENAIRPFVVGNWLFSDTVHGAQASANLYTMIETAKANGLEPYAYLRRVFAELPKTETVEQIEVLIPYQLDQAVLNTDPA